MKKKSHGMNLITSLLFGPLGALYVGFAPMLLSFIVLAVLKASTDSNYYVYAGVVATNILMTFEYNSRVGKPNE